MKNFQQHIINQNENILKAFELLNNVPETLTLFVVNDKNQMLGTLTDGDIRRGFLYGRNTNNKVGDFMKPDFHALTERPDPLEIFRIKKLGIRLLPVLKRDKTIKRVIDLHKTKTVLPVDVVIMAGGKGERLRPLTNKTPKPMLPLGNKPILEHNIDRLISYGIENIYISVNYLAEQLMDYFGDGSEKGVNIHYIQEKQFLGTIGSMSLVKEYHNPSILLINSDLFTDADIEDLYLNMKLNNADMAVASIPYTVNIPFAILKREKGRVTGLKEKPSNTHYANAGIYLMKRELLELIPKDEFYNATDLIEKVIETGGKVIDNPITGYWIDIGRQEEYEKAKEIMKHVKHE